MPFALQPLEEQDTLEWCHVHYSAFSRFLGCLWKHSPTEENFAEMAKQRALGMADPSSHVLKVVDTGLGRIAGVACWKIYLQERTREQLEESFQELPYTSDINAEARKAFMGNLHKSRRTLMGTGPCILLASLVVRPEYQRQGVGHLLMDWGTSQADKLGLVGYLESSKNGLVLYNRYGYVPHSEEYFDTRPFGGSEIDRHTIMFRQPKQQI